MCVLTLIEISIAIVVNAFVAPIALSTSQAAVRESGKSQLSV